MWPGHMKGIHISHDWCDHVTWKASIHHMTDIMWQLFINHMTDIMWQVFINHMTDIMWQVCGTSSLNVQQITTQNKINTKIKM